MQKKLDKLFNSENWKAARKLILSELRKEPKSHWLLSRLSLTYYEEYNYKKALQISLKAQAIEPDCPLVIWDLAGSYDMLGDEKEAIKLYQSIIQRGIDSIAYGQCGEGVASARGLIADSYYRISCCYQSLGAKKKAQTYLRKHLSLRGPGCRSIYSLRQVQTKVA